MTATAKKRPTRRQRAMRRAALEQRWNSIPPTRLSRTTSMQPFVSLGPSETSVPKTRLASLVANIKKCERGIANLAMTHKPPAGASRRVTSTHHLPPHKMYDPELGMWTFAYKTIARFTATPTGQSTSAANGLFGPIDFTGITGGSGPLPITSSQILLAFTPTNGNQSPLQLCRDGNENNADTVSGWSQPYLWDTATFLPNMSMITEQHRVVNASIKVTYTGTTFANSGTVYVYQGPHISQFHKTEGAISKLSVAQMVQRIITHARTVPYDVEAFRDGKIFHIERGTQRRVFRSPYNALFPDSSYGNKLFSTPTTALPTTETGTAAADASATSAAAGTTTVTTDGTTWGDGTTGTWGDGSQGPHANAIDHAHTHSVTVLTSGDSVSGIPPTMQAFYMFSDGLSLTGSNFLIEAIQHAEIQIDPDATSHIGLQTPPNNHVPDPDAGDHTVHLSGSSASRVPATKLGKK